MGRSLLPCLLVAAVLCAWPPECRAQEPATQSADASKASAPKYTDEEAAAFLKAVIAHEYPAPLPTFDMGRFTDTQATLVFTAIGAHFDKVQKLAADRLAESEAAFRKKWLDAPEPAPPPKKGLSPIEAAILSNMLRPQPPIKVDPPYFMPPVATANTWIDSVSRNGAIVRLSDGSVWQIHDLDQLRSGLWLPVQPAVVSSGSLIGESILVNTSRGESVRAKRVR